MICGDGDGGAFGLVGLLSSGVVKWANVTKPIWCFRYPLGT